MPEHEAISSLVSWSTAGLLIAFVAFLLVVWNIWRRKNRAEQDRAARLPLEDDK